MGWTKVAYQPLLHLLELFHVPCTGERCVEIMTGDLKLGDLRHLTICKGDLPLRTEIVPGFMIFGSFLVDPFYWGIVS